MVPLYSSSSSTRAHHLLAGTSATATALACLMQLPHVLLQIEVAAEALGADLARVRLLVVVRVHVEGQVVDLVEGLVADIALVRLVAAVRQLVVLVVALLVEALAAVLAHERLVPRMYPGVRVQRGRPIECLAAGVTLVRLLRRMNDLMPAQSARLSKALAADLADERASARVDGHVSREIVVGVEHLSALLARERLLLVGRTQGTATGAGRIVAVLGCRIVSMVVMMVVLGQGITDTDVTARVVTLRTVTVQAAPAPATRTVLEATTAHSATQIRHHSRRCVQAIVSMLMRVVTAAIEGGPAHRMM